MPLLLVQEYHIQMAHMALFVRGVVSAGIFARQDGYSGLQREGQLLYATPGSIWLAGQGLRRCRLRVCIVLLLSALYIPQLLNSLPHIIKAFLDNERRKILD